MGHHDNQTAEAPPGMEAEAPAEGEPAAAETPPAQ